MNVMFTVQGEGRGHLTQAVAMSEMLERRGHTIVGVVAGSNQSRKLPVFFEQAFSIPVHQIPSPGFSVRNGRSISLSGSAARVLRNLFAYERSLHTLREAIQSFRPDLIINFLEPLMGLYNCLWRHKVPVLAVGHQFMLEHPRYIKVRQFPLQQFGMRQYVRLAGARSARLGLSFYPAPDLPERRLFVCPPILRKQLFELNPHASGQYLLVYLLNHGYAAQIIRWHEKYPDVPIHCFYDKPGAEAEDYYDEKLVFHRIHGEKFLSLMANSRGVACTAGFESVSEAVYLGKPLLMVPVENHLEQYLNSHDAEQAGLALRDTTFRLSRLMDAPLLPGIPNFKAWVDQAEGIAMRVVEQTLRFQI